MDSRKFLLVLGVCILGGVLGILSVSASRIDTDLIHQPDPLPLLYPLPEFALVDSAGEEIGLDDLRGRVWVANFIFTSCAGVCPPMSRNMAELHEAFAADQDVHFVSFSVDPATDTPEVLAEYAERYGADTTRWHFLTGAIEDIHSLAAEGFKVGSLDEPVFHSDKFILVDREGTVRGYYTGPESEDMLTLAGDISLLLRERAR